MMDTLSKQQRHNNMASIKGKNTKPEMIVRRYLWHSGFRYRVNNPRLPGHPDIVLRKYRTCIFVNGCFWHGHEGCRHYVVPKTNTDFWVRKIMRNKERDKETQQQLARMGWHCITVWECELKKDRREQTLASLAFTLNHIYLKDRSILYQVPEEETGMCIAAEPEGEY
ncbi:endonuclease [Prevotella fusca JCM 17724]|uniref:Endonuclease n=2 Tax=Prevotella fusca JCM 17724 TaxID=1236517 RepID=A0A0K1NNP2_9BACT|nr:endonuclease [Prevotella fusca JCM 17724]